MANTLKNNAKIFMVNKMKYCTFTFLFFILLCITQPAHSIMNVVHATPRKYIFDKEHTSILFFVNHLGFSDKIGRFDDYEGYFIFDEENPTKSMVDVNIKPTGIDTFSLDLNKILQSKYWFNSKEHPNIHFKSTQIVVTGENQADITGWLSLLGKDKPLTLHVKFNKTGTHPITHDYVAGFSADCVVNRSQFGMNNGVPFIGEDVRIHMEIEGISPQSEQ